MIYSLTSAMRVRSSRHDHRSKARDAGGAGACVPINGPHSQPNEPGEHQLYCSPDDYERRLLWRMCQPFGGGNLRPHHRRLANTGRDDPASGDRRQPSTAYYM